MVSILYGSDLPTPPRAPVRIVAPALQQEDQGPPKILWGGRYRKQPYGFPSFRTFLNVGSLKQSNIWHGSYYSRKSSNEERDKHAEFYVNIEGVWHRLYAKDIAKVTNKNVNVFLAKKKVEEVARGLNDNSLSEALALLDTALG